MDLVYNSVINSVQKLSSKSTTHVMLPVYGTQASSTVLHFSCKTGEPQINISSSPPSNELSIGAAINLTCTAWQSDKLAKNPNKRPHTIEWFDPQDKRIGQCLAEERPAAKVMKCSLEVRALTSKQLGYYTCRARNGLNRCSTKKVRIFLQGKEYEPEGSVAKVILLSTSVCPSSHE